MQDAPPMEIHIYDNRPAGSEGWNWKEGMNNHNSVKVMTVYNVADPTLTVVTPDSSVANGTAVIICPGGGFHFIAIDHEGMQVAQSLAKKGITALILKYRLVHIEGDNPFDDMVNAEDPKAWDEESYPIIPLAVADGRQAIRYVRDHAAQYNIHPDRIGIMGFSAGGMVAGLTAFNYSVENRPDFVAPIYGDLPASRLGEVATDAPPLYLACTQDDEFEFASHAIGMYNLWYAAKRPTELHLFTSGGHGFGIGHPSNTTHQWLDKFSDWLLMMGLMEKR